MNAYEAEAARLRALPQEDYDDEVYERVIAAVDFDALYRLEQELWTELTMRDPSLDSDDPETITKLCDATKATVDRLFVQVLTDERRYVKDEPPTEAQAADCACCRMAREDYFRRNA